MCHREFLPCWALLRATKMPTLPQGRIVMHRVGNVDLKLEDEKKPTPRQCLERNGIHDSQKSNACYCTTGQEWNKTKEFPEHTKELKGMFECVQYS